MKLNKLFIIAGLALSMLSCKKEDIISKLGSSSNGEFIPEARVTLNTRRPAIGDSVILTTSAWHKNDKLTSIEYVADQYDIYGVNLKLPATNLETYSETNKTLMISDTLRSKESYFYINSQNNGLDAYYLTESNSYTVSAPFKGFVVPAIADEDLINSLSEQSFRALKSQLALVIAVSDYQLLFPTATDAEFTLSGASRVGISAAGKENLIENLTAANLNSILVSATKKGSLKTILTVNVLGQTAANFQVVNEFDTEY